MICNNRAMNDVVDLKLSAAAAAGMSRGGIVRCVDIYVCHSKRPYLRLERKL